MNEQPKARTFDRAALGQITLVLQGGGSLAAYQAGVYQALHESGLEPDWIIGTSIGSVNAALIAGNPPEKRLKRLRDFWFRVANAPLTQFASFFMALGPWAMHMLTALVGVPGFYQPNPWVAWAWTFPVGAELAAFYTTLPLRLVLEELTDSKFLNAGRPRLTLGAAQIRTSEMCYFDSRDMPLNIGHVLASTALPPVFPAWRLGHQLFWDGGLVTRAPIETVFDDTSRCSGLVFAVQMWRPEGQAPETMRDVLERMKDLHYSSNASSHIARQKQIHKLRHVVRKLSAILPPEVSKSPEVQALASYGCPTAMHVIHLVAPPFKDEERADDNDFSPAAVAAHWQAGFMDAMKVIDKAPWNDTYDPLEGFILHEYRAGEVTFEG